MEYLLAIEYKDIWCLECHSCGRFFMVEDENSFRIHQYCFKCFKREKGDVVSLNRGSRFFLTD